LNQIGRRLTEDLNAKSKRHRLLLMLDDFQPWDGSISSKAPWRSWPVMA